MAEDLVQTFLKGQQMEMDLINSAQNNAINKALRQVQLRDQHSDMLEKEALAQPRFEQQLAALNYDKTKFDNAALTSNALVNPRIERELSDIGLSILKNAESTKDINALSDLQRAAKAQDADTDLKRAVIDNTVVTLSGDDLVRQGTETARAAADNAGIDAIDARTSYGVAQSNEGQIAEDKRLKLDAELGLNQVTYSDAGVAVAAKDLEREIALSSLSPSGVKDYLMEVRADGVSSPDRKIASQSLLESIQSQEEVLERQHYVDQIVTDPVSVAKALGVRVAASADGGMQILDATGAPLQTVDANTLRLMLANKLGVETETYKTLVQESGKNQRADKRAESSTSDILSLLRAN